MYVVTAIWGTCSYSSILRTLALVSADRRINPLSQGPLGPSPRELTISSDPKSLDKKMFTFADYHPRTSLSLLTPLLDQSLTKKA